MRLTCSAALVAIVALGTIAASSGQKGAPASPVIVLETMRGVIEIETFPQEAPKTVERILQLVRKNFYNGMRFHRAEANFLIQIGDPVSRDMSREAWWGRGPGTGKPLGVAEISKKLRHAAGSVGMAHAGDPALADTQFYILRQPRPGLDGKYAIFGRVISGMDVVAKIQRADMLKRASVRE